MVSPIYQQKQNYRWNIECISLIFWNDHDFGENSERKVFIVTKELNLKKQELAKGIKEFNVKSTFCIGNKWQGRWTIVQGGKCDLRFDPQ